MHFPVRNPVNLFRNVSLQSKTFVNVNVLQGHCCHSGLKAASRDFAISSLVYSGGLEYNSMI